MSESSAITKRILIVDDSAVMRAMIDDMLADQPGVQVIGVARSADEACRLVSTASPHIVIIDLCLPYIDGSRLLGRLSGRAGLCKVIVSNRANLSVAIRQKLIELGAAAIFDKQDIIRDPKAFVAALRLAANRAAAPSPPPPRPNVVFAADRFPVPPDELLRVRAVRALKIANLDPDRRLDILARHLARLTDYPIASVNVIDTDLLWIKAGVGVAPISLPRGESICAHALCAEGPMVVADAMADPVLCAVPAVAGAPNLRAYIGAPIVTKGVRVGMACVADMRPRVASRAEIDVVTDIAALVASALEIPPAVLCAA